MVSPYSAFALIVGRSPTRCGIGEIECHEEKFPVEGPPLRLQSLAGNPFATVPKKIVLFARRQIDPACGFFSSASAVLSRSAG